MVSKMRTALMLVACVFALFAPFATASTRALMQGGNELEGMLHPLRRRPGDGFHLTSGSSWMRELEHLSGQRRALMQDEKSRDTPWSNYAPPKQGTPDNNDRNVNTAGCSRPLAPAVVP